MAVTTGVFLVDLFGIITGLLAVFYVYFKWSYQYWSRRNVPYLKPKIPFGNVSNPFNKKVSESEWSKNVYTKSRENGYKYCGLYTITRPTLLISDLDITKLILTKDFPHFTDRGLYTNEKDDPLSAHLFAVGGAKWRKLRTKLSPTFTSGKMKAMFQTLVDTGLVLEKYFQDSICTNDAVDIKDVLGKFSTDIIGSCAFGIECNSFKDPNSPFREYGKKIFQRSKLQLLKFMFCSNFINLGRALHIKLNTDDVTNFFRKLVEDVVYYREKKNVVRKDFMQLLIEMRNKKEDDGLSDNDDISKPLTIDEMMAQSFVFFIAGFETSSTTMTFALYELANHPDIQDKVREEIKTILAKHDNKITYASLNDMKYMKQVIDETLRKYPPVPFITRECVKEYKVPGETLVIEKGIQTIIPIRGIHCDPQIYKNPDVFDPERFSDENKKTRHPYAHIPFGEGPRICIGERFGIMQTKVGLTSLLRNYKVKVHQKTKMPLKLDPRQFIPTTDGTMWLSFEKV